MFRMCQFKVRVHCTLWCIHKIPFLYIVSSPTSVIVTSDPIIPIRPVGFDVTLTCTVELSPAVDIIVIVNTVWTGPDGFMSTNTAQPVMGSTTTYTSTAMVSSFGRDQSGVYTCTATVSSTSQYLITIGSLVGSATIIAGQILQLMFDTMITIRRLPFFKWQQIECLKLLNSNTSYHTSVAVPCVSLVSNFL